MTVSLEATLYGARDLRLTERELPPLEAGKVRVRFRAGGICGSDLHYFAHGKNGPFTVKEPLTLGHEIAGEIEALGEGVTGLSIGDRVAVNPSHPCGKCAACQSGRSNLCRNGTFMGSASRSPHIQGGFASLFDVWADQAHVVPAGTDWSAIALAEPLAVCLHAANRAGDLTGKTVAVTGCGPIGILAAMSARLRGASRVVVSDIVAAPLKFAERLGFETVQLSETISLPSSTFEVVLEASGAEAALAGAIDAAAPGAVIVQIGNMPKDRVAVPINALSVKEIDLRGTLRFGSTFAEAVDAIITGKIDAASLVTASVPLDRAVEALNLASDRTQSMKVTLVN